MVVSRRIVGRDAELASLRDFVASLSDGVAVLVLEGEAGMGKTTLWSAGVAYAGEREVAVLQARPAESETSLSFSAARDLLDPVLDDALAALVPAQRRALARALVLDEGEGPAPDPHAVGVAVLNALRSLAAERPLVVAVDDVQWLDSASAAALAFAGRRLREEPIALLLARRLSLESGLVAELARSLPPERLRRLELGPLGPSELHRVVQEHLATTLPRPLLREVHDASGGNPFYALEIVRMLQRTGVSIEAGHPLPVPDSLRDLVHGRLLALPPESRDFLLAAAAHAHPTVAIAEAASGVARAEGLRPALEARVIDLEGDRIRFAHPLLAAGAYEVADPLRRAEVHARLAELLDDPEARAWQLAASVDEPDETVAAALEDAARHARSRGAPRPAALLLERSHELTPSELEDAAHRRAVDAAYLHFEAGDSPRAVVQLRELIGQLPPGRRRAAALVRLARVRSFDAQAEGADLFRRALEEAEGDAELLAVAHEGVAACLFRLRERLHEAAEHAESAAQLALELGDEALAAEALSSRLLAESLLGSKSAAKTLARALALQDAADERRVLGQPLCIAAVHWWWADELDRARGVLLDMLERARELGDEASVPYVLVILGQVECVRGDLAAARERAREGLEASEQSGQHTTLVYSLALEALAEAHLGAAERARVTATRALARVPETAARPAELLSRWALGHVELASGGPEDAAAWLGPAVAFARQEEFGEPGAMRFVPDQVEALLELGRREEAEELLGWYEGHARRLRRVSALAACARCRGLLAAAEGRLEEALRAYEEALRWHAKVELPLDRGRTLLALGAAQRRMKRRREARATLGQALALFERIGAALWAERSRAELRRISGRAPAAGALTPAEERVAALVAEGKTNREVAAALYLSERTVEGHLSRVFAKLGIRHRGELAAALASRHNQVAVPSNTGDSPVSSGSPAS